MCGIAGVVSGSATPCLAETVSAMVAALAHRGPDSAGVQSLGPCVLGNTRLAIIDPTEIGRQPMCNEDGTVWITFNGEIYNASEHRKRLLEKGHRFRSATDTEVILHLYEEFGPECVQQLRGMFAIAIWDNRSQKLVLLRDRLGVKPLYYAFCDGGVLFASEIKALLASGRVSRKLDPLGVRIFLQLGHVPPPWTALAAVKPLEPGQMAVWHDGKFEVSTYWSLPRPDGSQPRAHGGQITEQLAEQLLEAARLHLVSDVPISLFLSGGADSACLGALLQSAGAHNLTALTVSFEETAFDEGELSSRTAQLLRIPQYILPLSARQVQEDVARAIWAMDQPTVDGINSYAVSRIAADAGFKVAISGQGGDELFGGYESLAWFTRFYRYANRLRMFPLGNLGRLLVRDDLPYSWRKISYLLRVRDPFVASQLAVKVLFLEEDLERLLTPALDANSNGSPALKHLEHWSALIEGCDLKERVSFMDVHTHLEPRLLRDLDAMSMAHSLEVRPVFLDHALVEFVHSIPASMRMQQKRLLFDAVRGYLPPTLLEDLRARPKRTFTFPFARWLTRGLRPMVEETFAPEHLRHVGVFRPGYVRSIWRRYCQSPSSVGWSRIWSLLVLQRWCETMQVSL
jgi:asparagine synthase (glutamine-hydrolysing)